MAVAVTAMTTESPILVALASRPTAGSLLVDNGGRTAVADALRFVDAMGRALRVAGLPEATR
ncbi:MAG: hypothetical protein QOD72_1979, partial [Acidimicrobiaceae bacterium]|nr:hypothetical protein [Acidimicrobiaceae bacterium]